ncbi:MAG: glycosyltransferase family 2 protein [Gemmobacter sp.]|nr:glycosyltransferase family 2 protein [Gemmobacter sp.]
MQSFRLDRTANVILRIDGGMLATQQIQFLDDAGLCLLVMLARTRTVLGQQRQELVVNSVDPEGTWMSEIAVELPGLLTETLELRFCDWQVEVSQGGRQRLLSFNPSVSFGRHATPLRAVAMRTNLPVTRLMLATGALPPPPLPDDGAPAPGDRTISFVVLHPRRADPAQIRALANSGLWFCEAIPVEVSPDGDMENDARIAAALARARGTFVAVVSGEWRLRDLRQLMQRFNALQRPDAVMLAAASPLLEPGRFWGVVLPRQFRGEPSLRLRGGMMTVHPGVLSAGFWQVPPIWEDTAGVFALRASCARLPVDRDDTGRLLEPLMRAAIQIHAMAPGSGADPACGIGPAYGGLHVDRAPLEGPLTPRHLLAHLREVADSECSSHFMLWTPEAFSAARARAWPRRALFADAELAADATGAPVGFLIARAVLAAPLFSEALAALPPALRGQLDAVQPDIPALIGALRDVMQACDLVVGYTDVAALDAAAATGQGTHMLRPLWLEEKETLHRLLNRPLPEDEEVALRALVEGPDGFETLVLQTLQYRLVTDICDHAIAADLRLPSAGFVARLVEVALVSGHADDDELRCWMLERLLARNYHTEAMPLLRPVPLGIAPVLAMRLRTLDIVLRDRDPQDEAWLDCVLTDVMPEAWPDLPETEIAGAAALASALIAYVGHREDWAGVLALAADLPDTLTLRHDAEELILMARVRTGAHDGLASRMAALARAGRISPWSHHRLAMMLADAMGNPAAVAGAVQRLLEGEADMAALLNPPSRFRLLGPAPASGRTGGVAPVAPGQIACIIVARNEFVRLKWLHQYYRHLGVDRFFLIDNLSDDKTLAYFAAQPDVTVLQTAENYRDTRYGVKWHNEVADAWAENRWVLTVDADEALVFDGCDRPGALHDLVARLEAEGAEGFFAPMFDMYAEGALSETALEPGDSLIDRFPMLDGAGYRFAPKPGYPGRAMTGGVRIRLFWNNWHVPDTPHIVMQKVPLVRWKRGFRYLASTHDMTPVKVARETGALLHYKFLPDFHARAMEEVRRNQHYEGAREYRVYAEVLGRTGGGSFVGPESRRFAGFDTLVDMGVVTPPDPRPAPATDRPEPDAPAAALTVPPAALAEGNARQIAALDAVAPLSLPPLRASALPSAAPAGAAPPLPAGLLPPADASPFGASSTQGGGAPVLAGTQGGAPLPDPAAPLPQA